MKTIKKCFAQDSLFSLKYKKVNYFGEDFCKGAFD